MYSLVKFLFFVAQTFWNLLSVDRNALRNVPDPTKYLAMILLSCFWCLAFGLYVGELLTIGYNMIGHVAIISMVFVTWFVFRSYETNNRGEDFLRQPDRSSRCYELTDEERIIASKQIESKLTLKEKL